MKAEIISVGTELLLGHTINRDAAILARELAALGIDLMRVQTVGDNAKRLEEALALAAGSADLIFTTGGLGPTDDDLTKSTIAAFAGAPLKEHPESLARLKEYFGTRPMTPNQLRQAFLPEGAAVFANQVGTAPGCAVSLPDGKAIIMLPGPPRELTRMFSDSVMPWLLGKSNSVIQSVDIHTFGIGEGAAAEKIKDLMKGANPTVAPYAHGGEMFVRVTAKAADRAEASRLCDPVVAEIKVRLGDVVYGDDVVSLEEAVFRDLLRLGKTTSTAESCTGGLLAKRLTDLAGSSQVFGLGVVTYSNTAKEKVLGIDPGLLASKGAVSREVAAAMAESIRKIAGSDLGLGVTGIAGPDGATPQKPLGLVYIALAVPDQTFVYEHRLQGRYPGRAWVRERSASIALDLARRYLNGLPVTD